MGIAYVMRNRVKIMNLHSRQFHFFMACAFAVAVFVAYQSFYGTEHSQAYASLNDGEVSGERMLNYKPARKRILRSRLKDDANHILELKGHDIVQIFSEPELVRRDLPTTIWQYRNDACVMDLYFTVGAAGNVARSDVVHYEVRGRDTRAEKPLNLDDCIGDLMPDDTMMSLINVDAVYKAATR